MMNYLKQLNERERLLLLVAVPVLAILLLYSLVWRPLSGTVELLQHRVQKQQDTLQYMRKAAQQVKALQQQKSAQSRGGGRQSLLALVDRTVKQAGLTRALKRVEPDGADKVRVRLEGAGFDTMIGWLESLQSRYGIQIESISVDALDNPGLVNVRLMLIGMS